MTVNLIHLAFAARNALARGLVVCPVSVSTILGVDQRLLFPRGPSHTPEGTGLALVEATMILMDSRVATISLIRKADSITV